jgi:hypothetical protein
MAGKGSKPGERRGGRSKGTPNKVTRELKDMILSALDKSGGEKYLVKQAEENPVAFMTLLGKVLPKDITVAGDEDKPIYHAVRRIIVRPSGNPDS